MNRQILEMMSAAEGRYLAAAEQALLREQAQGIEARLTAMTEVSTKETAIVDRAVKEVTRAYPDFEKKYKGAAQTAARDQSMVLRYATLAMVRNDPQYLADSLLTWLTTILKGVGFTPQFIEDAYKILERSAAKELSPASIKLLQPVLTQCITTLSGRSAAPPAPEPR
jgi:hypothetical protein